MRRPMQRAAAGSTRATRMMISASTAAALLLSQLCSVAAQPPSCPSSCGGVSVPYPFGIGDGCYHSAAFNLTCDRKHQPPRLLLGNGSTLHVVIGISLRDATVRVSTPGEIEINYPSMLCDGTPNGTGWWGGFVDGGSPYILSAKHNQFTVTGCNVQATLLGDSTNIITGCSSFCSMTDTWSGAVTSSPRPEAGAMCSGIGCCQTPIPIGRTDYLMQFRYLDQNHEYDSKLHMAVIVAEQGWFDNVSAELLNESASDNSTQALLTAVPVVLEWAFDSVPLVMPRGEDANSTCPKDAASSACRSGYSSCHDVSSFYRSGYVCRCQDGYDGNPYLTGGCQDIDECLHPEKCFGECTNTPGGYVCRCRYDGNLTGGCQDIDECLHPEKCFGECTNMPGGYVCRCPRGARGNPLIRDGCVKSSLGLIVGLGVGSGAAFLFLVLGANFAIRKIKHRRIKMLRQRFFKQNRGHLLQQLISQKADIAERMVIPLVELEKETRVERGRRQAGSIVWKKSSYCRQDTPGSEALCVCLIKKRLLSLHTRF